MEKYFAIEMEIVLLKHSIGVCFIADICITQWKSSVSMKKDIKSSDLPPLYLHIFSDVLSQWCNDIFAVINFLYYLVHAAGSGQYGGN